MKITILLLLALCLPALARLGESNVEIRQRYGPVLKRIEQGTNTWMGCYMFKEYTVGVVFKNNVSQCEILQPVEQRKFTDDEADALLAGIAGKGKWIKDSGIMFMKQAWTNPEIRAKAEVEDKPLGASVLTVMSIEFINDADEKQKAEDKKKAEGF
jgi:hypothetical protein